MFMSSSSFDFSSPFELRSAIVCPSSIVTYSSPDLMELACIFATLPSALTMVSESVSMNRAA